MKEKCINHPDRDALSFCHSCKGFFCADCLTEGREYYFCHKPRCQKALNEEVFIKCSNHANREAFGYCSSCGRPYCVECLVVESTNVLSPRAIPLQDLVSTPAIDDDDLLLYCGQDNCQEKLNEGIQNIKQVRKSILFLGLLSIFFSFAIFTYVKITGYQHMDLRETFLMIFVLFLLPFPPTIIIAYAYRSRGNKVSAKTLISIYTVSWAIIAAFILIMTITEDITQRQLTAGTTTLAHLEKRC